MTDEVKREVGKIKGVSFGLLDGRIGFMFELGGENWATSDTSWGYWATKRSSRTEWSERERLVSLGDKVMRMADLLIAAKVQHMSQLEGKPIEAVFKNNLLESWRILTEVL